MQWTLEVVQVPVSDVERAKEFYAGPLGFAVDFDIADGSGKRFVQLTPPGSGCSIQISSGYHRDLIPGSLRATVLVVPDIRAAHRELEARGLDTGGVVVSDNGLEYRPARDDEALDNVGFLRLTDPDGNEWAVQQISSRAQG